MKIFKVTTVLYNYIDAIKNHNQDKQRQTAIFNKEKSGLCARCNMCARLKKTDNWQQKKNRHLKGILLAT